MHILFILDYFSPYIGGIETLFDDITDFCVEKWHTVTILTSHHNSKLPKIEKRKWVTIYRVGKNRITILWQALIRSIKNKTVLQSIDHIHTSTFTASIPARIISKLYKKTCTITVHEIYDNLRYHIKGQKGRLYIRFERLLFKLKRDHIITVSHYTNNMICDIHNLSNKNISVIYNQINTHFWNTSQVSYQEITELKKNHQLINLKIGLFIGRLGYEKGLPYLIEAMNYITHKENFKLIIIAPKDPHLYDKHIQSQIKSTKDHITNNNLSKNILWIDPVKNNETLRLWMAISDIGIIPSISEWFCYTAVQMQSMWLPLIVSKVGALPEVLDKQNIFIPYGKIKLLSDAINTQIEKPKKEDNMISNKDIQPINYQEYCNIFEKISNKNILSIR